MLCTSGLTSTQQCDGRESFKALKMLLPYCVVDGLGSLLTTRKALLVAHPLQAPINSTNPKTPNSETLQNRNP